MKCLLPVVKQEVGYPLAEEIRHEDDEDFLNRELQRLDEVNPVIAAWIRAFSVKTEDKLGAAYCGLCVYKLLENQAEADWMTQTFS